jgi:hypothetical protein
MVRRLKEDIRAVQGAFPKREVVRVPIEGLSEDAPELALSRLLDEYRTAREERFASTSRRAQAAAGLLVVGLQQRLLSSIEAFARSLKVHRATVERQREKGHAAVTANASIEPETLFTRPPDADDERAGWAPEEMEAEESTEVEAATAAAEAEAPRDAAADALWRREQALLDRMRRSPRRPGTSPTPSCVTSSAGSASTSALSWRPSDRRRRAHPRNGATGGCSSSPRIARARSAT